MVENKNIFKKLANSFLLPYVTKDKDSAYKELRFYISDKSYAKHVETKDYKHKEYNIHNKNNLKDILIETIANDGLEIKEHKINMMAEDITQKYFISKDFNPAKETIIFFPSNVGACDFSNIYFYHKYLRLRDKYNIIIPEHFGYLLNCDLKYSEDTQQVKEYYFNNNIPKQCREVTFDHVATAAGKSLENIRSKLKELYSITDDRKLNNRVILAGASLGSMIATKVAAENEKNSKPPFKYVLNIAPVINMKSASKEALKKWAGLPVLVSSYISIYSALCGILFGTTYAILAKCSSYSKPINLEFASAVAFVFSMLAVTIFFTGYFINAEKVGINQEDIDNLKQQTVHSFLVDGDIFGSVQENQKFVRDKDNMHFTNITNASKSEQLSGNIEYITPSEFFNPKKDINDMPSIKLHNILPDYLSKMLQYCDEKAPHLNGATNVKGVVATRQSL